MDIANYSKLGIDKIKSSSVLDTEDFSNMKNITKELQRSFEVQQMWRTETEIRYSVLNDTKFPTPASKYWQSIREQMVFYENLIKLSFDYQTEQTELELLELDILVKPKNKREELNQKLIRIKIDEKKFSLMTKRLQGHDRVREILIWEKVKEECKKESDFDIENVDTHQKESYAIRWSGEKELADKTQNASLYRASNSCLTTLLKDMKKLE